MPDQATLDRELRGATVATTRLRRTAVTIAVGLALVGSAAGCGDDAGDKPKAANLKAQLPSASAFPGYTQTSTDSWTEPVDLAVQLHRPEQTRPSVQLKALEKAGFVSGATAVFSGPRGRNHVVNIVQFDSPGGAREFLDYQYKEELKQPCAAACSEQEGDVPISGIPGAKGAKQVPAGNPPPDAPPPFTAYVALFTVGSTLYEVDGQGPGDDHAVKGETTKAAQALFAHVKR